jgi:ParB-like chromosome segregation protein Spo0J
MSLPKAPLGRVPPASKVDGIDPRRIETKEGRRPLDENKVVELMESIKIHGLLNPITVATTNGRIRKKGRVQLVAGAHRLEAWKRLWGDAEIPCTPMQAGKEDRYILRARLAEIEENLIRNDLDAAGRAALTAKHSDLIEELAQQEGWAWQNVAKEAQESLTSDQIDDLAERAQEVIDKQQSHLGRRLTYQEQVEILRSFMRQLGAKLPESKRGRPSEAGSASSLAKKEGRPTRSVQRDAQRAKALGVETLEKVTGTSLGTGVELDALVDLPQPDRDALVARAVEGETVSARKKAPLPVGKDGKRKKPKPLEMHDESGAPLQGYYRQILEMAKNLHRFAGQLRDLPNQRAKRRLSAEHAKQLKRDLQGLDKLDTGELFAARDFAVDDLDTVIAEGARQDAAIKAKAQRNAPEAPEPPAAAA